MTRVILYRDSSRRYCGFSISGHSGYADAGSDIICAAVSACSELLLAQLCDSFGFDATYDADPDTASVRCELFANDGANDESRNTASRLLDGFYRTMTEFSAEYPRFLTCTITEV